MTSNENPEMCSKCGGRCCKGMPGIAMPEDFDMGRGIEQELRAAIASGYWIFDYLDGENNTYFPRPATLETVGKVVYGLWLGTCAFLTDHGCALEFELRPHECRHLIPKAMDGGKCKHGDIGTYEYAKAWYEYQDMINKMIEELRPQRQITRPVPNDDYDIQRVETLSVGTDKIGGV